MPACYTSGQSSCPHRHPTCWASSQRSHTVSITPCRGAWTSALLTAHLSIEWECTASQIETPFVPAPQQLISSDDNNRSAALLADHRWNAESWRALRDSVLSSPCHPPGMALPKEQRGSGSIASAPVSHVSAPAYANGVWPPLCLVSVAQKIKLLTIVVFQCPFHPPPHGAQPDGSGWWDNRFAAQHLPWDIVRPSSGLKELTQMIMMKQLVLACCRHSNLNQSRSAVFYTLIKLM